MEWFFQMVTRKLLKLVFWFLLTHLKGLKIDMHCHITCPKWQNLGADFIHTQVCPKLSKASFGHLGILLLNAYDMEESELNRKESDIELLLGFGTLF